MRNKKLKSLEFLGEAPTEASQNLSAPELAPSDKRITGRTKPLSLKAKPEFHRELKQLAIEENCLMIEVLEKALANYQKSSQSYQERKDEKVSAKKREIKDPSPEKLNPHPYANFTCDNCESVFQNEMAYSVARDLKELKNYPTYCLDCVVR